MKRLLAVSGLDLAILRKNDGCNSLFACAASGHDMATELLLNLSRYGKELLPLRRHDGCSCLHISVYMGHEKVFKLVLHAGKEVGLEAEMLSMTTFDGSSCLFASVQMGYPSIAKKLIDVGGRELVDMTRKNGMSCIVVVRHKIARLGPYCTQKIEHQHREVLAMIENAYLRFGLEPQ